MDGSLVRSQHFVSSFTFIRRRQCLRFEVGLGLRADLTQFEVIVLSHAIFFTLPSSSLFATTDSFSQSPLHEFSRHSHFILSFLSNALSRERERERERERNDSFNFSRSLASSICQRAQGDAKNLRKPLHMKWLLSLSCLNSRKELKLSKNGKYSDISLATLIDFFSFFNHLLLPSFKSPKRALLRPLFHALAAKVWTQLDLIRPFIVYRGKQKGM